MIGSLARELDVGAVHISADFTPYGIRRDHAVAVALGDVPLVPTGSPYAVAPGRVRKADGKPYKVFTLSAGLVGAQLASTGIDQQRNRELGGSDGTRLRGADSRR